jgi:hypothetical protein
MNNIGVIISLVIIFGGLLVIFVYSLKGRDIDRRIIYLFIFVSVAAPLIFEFQFKETPTPIVEAVFDRIDNMEPGSKILISFDFDPAMAPEVQPMANAFIRHAIVKGHKLYLMSLWATGQALLTQTVDSVIRREFPTYVEGKDFAVLGYKAGNEGVLNVIITNFEKMYSTDVTGRPIREMPVFVGVKSVKDMDLAISIGGGKPGAKEWVLYVGDPGNVPMAAGLAAVSAPLLYPYYPRQLLGLLGGVKGAAEYEYLLQEKYPQFKETPTPALRMMGPQTLAHIVIMSFIVIGNVIFIRQRRKARL